VSFNEDKLDIHIIWRNGVYTYCVLELPASLSIGNYSSLSKPTVIVKGGYLVRTAEISGGELRLLGDVNTTTEIEMVYEPTRKVTNLTFNGIPLRSERSNTGTLKGVVNFEAPKLVFPNFSKLRWKYLNSLPELWSSYDNSAWSPYNNTATTNPQKLATPNSLYASDYGYHTGSLIYRGRFTANGTESNFRVTTAGGFAFGHSIWLNNTFLGSWTGRNANSKYEQTLAIWHKLQVGMPYVFTVLIDHMGQDEEAPGTNTIKAPLGILNYRLEGHLDSDILWKIQAILGENNTAIWLGDRVMKERCMLNGRDTISQMRQLRVGLL
jgi:beta-galactosidase